MRRVQLAEKLDHRKRAEAMAVSRIKRTIINPAALLEARSP